ncbi:SdrD B-like domain-containing protein, partial [Gilliamella sp. Choc4-2]|uniref:SdrD B-like domain-containing protein n=1 Tax=Gilliamella sp. Choc4-2 TaxID=3120237 RepID=UPI001147982F
MDSWQSIEIGKIIPQVEKNLRISGEKIMRTEHNVAVEINRKISVKKGYRYVFILKHLTQILGAFIFMLMAVSIANATTISGKVYWDFDNHQSFNMPLNNIMVELKDASGNSLAQTITQNDGSYLFDNLQLGQYTVIASTSNNESINRTLNLSSSTGELGVNLFLQGMGGSIHLSVKDENNVGVKDVPITLINSVSTNGQLILISDDNGDIKINNTLKGYANSAVFGPINLDTSTYILWDVVLPNNSHRYQDTIDFSSMNGVDQSGTFNIKALNRWGVDGIVAIDQNYDNIYSAENDTGAIGMDVELYYPGTTTKVLGTKTITTTENGKFRFEKLAVATYDIKVTNVAMPYIPVNAMSATITIPALGNLSSPDFLLQVDQSDHSLAGVLGNVFELALNQQAQPGADSGVENGNTKPTKGSRGFSTDVILYQHDGTSWKKIVTQRSNNQNAGSYQFRGLTKGKDYKVAIMEDGIDVNKYVFINDTDGKSSSTSPQSRSLHKGRVTLSNGTQDNIAGKEIIVTNLNNTISNQNFWFSPKFNQSLGGMIVSTTLKTANNHDSYATSINGLSTRTASAYMKLSFYEEDGVTPLVVDGQPVKATYETQGFYGTRSWVTARTDRAGIYYYSLDDYDNTKLDYESRSNFLINISPNSGFEDVIIFRGKTPNSISGYIYLNNSHKGTIGSYNPEQDTPISSNRVVLQRKLPSGKWNDITYFATDSNGWYNFTNLPDGEYRVIAKKEYGNISNITKDDVDFEGNDQNNTINSDGSSTIQVTISGGQNYNRDTNFWYKLKVNDNILRGQVYLDTYKGNGELEIGQTYNENDLPLFDADVLLCRLGAESDCVIGGPLYIAHKRTNVDGSYLFTSTDDGIVPNTEYRVKVIRHGTTAVTNSTQGLAPSYIVKFNQNSVPITKNFLMQGKAEFIGYPVNDLNGDVQYAGENTYETGQGNFKIYYYNGSSYVFWGDIGTYYHSINLKMLPEGKYRIIHNKDSNKNYIDIADMDPNTELGTFDFEVNSSGNFTHNNQPSSKQLFLQAISVSDKFNEVFSGKIYLDVSGTGVKTDASIELTAADLQHLNSGNLSVEGIFTPRIYPGYYNGSLSSIESTPDFIDNQVSANGKFAYTKANSTRGGLYATNMILHLKGLNSSQFELVGNSSDPLQSYLPNQIRNNLEYMQVSNVTSAPNQYWLVKLKNNTEISGQLYYDLNDDGKFNRDDQDVGLSGIKVALYRNNQLYSYTLTDNNGHYAFKNLYDDSYTIKVPTQSEDQRYELRSPSDTSPVITISPSKPTASGADLDFIYKKNGDAVIAGSVMIDINNNGTAEYSYNKTGDLPLKDIKVNLYQGVSGNLSLFASVNTNEFGRFSFNNLPLNNSYTVMLDMQTLSQDYGIIVNADGNTNSSLTPIVFDDKGRTEQNKFFLIAGGSNPYPAAGNNSTSAIKSGISGETLVEVDVSTNEPMAGVLISLIDSNGNELVRQYSDTNGKYHFYNLPNGNYKVNVLDPPKGYTLIKNSDGTTQPIDTLSGINLQSSGVENKNFYYKKASIGGIEGKIYVDFADNNSDFARLNHFAHLLSDTTPATIELHEGSDGNGTLLMTRTSVDGVYSFPNLMYGDTAHYSVKIIMSSIPNYAFKMSKAGSQPSDVVIPVTLLTEQGSFDNHFMIVGTQEIGGNVWIDANNNNTRDVDETIDGVDVTLSYMAPGKNQYEELKSTTTADIAINGVSTSQHGQYLFDKLPKGTNYQIKVKTPEATTLIPVSQVADNADTFKFEPLNQNSFNSSTGYKYSGTIKGHVSIDVDYSKNKTDVDDHLKGLKLVLKKVVTTAVSQQGDITVETDANGNFSVENLSMGQWVITTATSQSNVADWGSYKLSYTDNGTGAVEAVTNDLALNVTLSTTNPSVNNIDIGYRGDSKITGYVVIDRDGDHRYSNDDMAFSELSTPITPKLILTSATNSVGFTSREVVVNSDGSFEVSDLSQHKYKLTSVVNDTNYKIVFSPSNSTPASESAIFDVSGANDTSYVANPETRAFGYAINRTLSGKVYFDIGGKKEASLLNPPLDGAIVKVENKYNNKVLTYTQTVDSNGEFSFSNITEGDWVVTVLHPTRRNLVYSYFVEKLVTPSLVNNGEITYSVNANTDSEIKLDLGMMGNSVVSGTVVYDNDSNEQLTANIDTGVVGLTINLIDPNNDAVIYVQVQTDSNGKFSFNNLAQGNYKIRVTDPSNHLNGYAISFSPTGKASTNNASDSVVIAFNSDNTQLDNQDFGYRGIVGVSGHIYQDILGKGEHNTNYPTLAGITVTATNQSNNITLTGISDANGNYLIQNLTPDTWQVKVSNYPQGWQKSYVNSVSGVTLNSDVTNITIASGSAVGQTVDFGVKGSAKIFGKVVVDMDINDNVSLNYHAAPIDRPLSDIPVLLKATGIAGSSEIRTTTDNTGHYEFDNLTAYHDYQITIDDQTLGSSYQLSFSHAMISGGQPSNSDQVTLIAVDQQVSDLDYGYISQRSLKGTIYKDYSGKGVHQAYHSTLDGVVIEAQNVNNPNIRLTAISGLNGQYTINNIADGKWKITVKLPSNPDYVYSYVVQPQGSSITPITDGAEIEISQSSSLITNVDFGLKGQASISGQVVIDMDSSDGNAIVAQDIGIDMLFPHYSVELFVGDDLIDTVEVVSTGTDVSELGNYKFNNLASEVFYTVKVSVPDVNYISSFMLTDSNIVPTTSQTDNEMKETYTFASATANIENASFAWGGTSGIKGKVFLDKDDDGVYNSSIDSPINELITLTFENVNNPAIHFSYTMVSGTVEYDITNIIPGKWNIVVSGVPTTLTASFDPDDAHHNADGSLKTPQTVDMATVEVVGNLTDQNFGYINGGVIEGKLVEDSAGTGLIGLANYPGLSGVNVYLLDSNEKHVMDKAGKPMLSTTDNEGKFSFRNLAIGSHDGNSITHNIRVLYGEYNDGVVSSDSNSPLYEKVPFFEKYTDIGG